MGIDIEQLQKYIVEPTLKAMDMYDESSAVLLPGTFLAESGAGRYIKQLGGGPALGIGQMEPSTYYDIWDNWINYRDDIRLRILRITGYSEEPRAEKLMVNVELATIMTRIHYFRVPAPLPAPEDIEGMAVYWKTYYNTDKGKGTVGHFMDTFKTRML